MRHQRLMDLGGSNLRLQNSDVTRGRVTRSSLPV